MLDGITLFGLDWHKTKLVQGQLKCESQRTSHCHVQIRHLHAYKRDFGRSRIPLLIPIQDLLEQSSAAPEFGLSEVGVHRARDRNLARRRNKSAAWGLYG